MLCRRRRCRRQASNSNKRNRRSFAFLTEEAVGLNTKKWPRKGAKSTARPAATKTVPGERLAQRRGGAEKDQEETPCLVFSAPLRLCAKKSLRECAILTDCSAKGLTGWGVDKEWILILHP